MKLRITDGATSAVAVMSIAIRVFFGVLIDMPDLHNANWISVLLGAIFATPMAFAALQLRNACNGAPLTMLIDQGQFKPLRLMTFIFTISAAIDGAVVTRGLSSSASYIALSRSSLFFLIIPLLLMCFWCIRLNGDAIGASARIWLKVLPVLSIITIAFQLGEYRPTWLMPLLGPGITQLIDGGIIVAGWMSTLIALFLITDRDGSGYYKPFNPLLTIWSGALISIFALLRQRMLVPALFGADASRIYQLDVLFANGRTSLSAQLPLLIVYFVAFFHAMILNGFLCAAMLQHTFRRISNFWACLISTVSIGILSFLTVSRREAALQISAWLFVAYSTMLVVVMLVVLSKKGGKQSA